MSGPPARRDLILTALAAGVAWAVQEQRHGRRHRADRRRLREVEATVEQQTELQQIAELVAAGRPTEEVCDRVATAAADLFDAQLAFVACFSGTDRGVLMGRHMRRPVPGYPAIGEALLFDSRGAIGRMIQTGATVRVAQGTFSPFAEQIGERIATPITLADGLWGTLAVAAAPGERLAADLEGRLERFAELVTLAIGNAEARDRLVTQAMSDPLTDLANHRAFVERLSEEFARVRRHGRPLALALFDTDRFKSINDTHGHLTGDRVLMEVADRLRDCARGEVLLARLGGDEFAALLPESDRDGALVVARRVCEAVRSRPLADGLRVTLSAGVCALESEMTMEALRRGADEALYQAKSQGRGKVGACGSAAPALAIDG